jgi:hypothetical protein
MISSRGSKLQLAIPYLERVIEIANLAKIVQELVDSSFVIFHEGVKGDHVSFLGV